MGIPSLIFFLIFAVPLIIFLLWVMRKDKQKGLLGIIIVVLLVILAVASSLKASKSELDRAKYEKNSSN